MLSTRSLELGGVLEGSSRNSKHQVHEQVRKRDLPESYWDERRHALNARKTQRSSDNKKARKAAQRQAEEAALAGLAANERERVLEEAKQQRIQAHLAQQAKLAEALEHGMCVVVDCSFVEGASPREMHSLAKQLQMSVGLNKRAERPVALTFTSYQGAVREFAVKMGGEQWPVRRVEGATLDSFPAGKVVVLSPDAEEALEALEDDKVYCIGGIVDRTPKKFVTQQFAERAKLGCKRLPIAEYPDLFHEPGGSHSKRHILNINDVLLALLEFRRTGDWRVALDAAIPHRKKQPHEALGKKRRLQAPGERCLDLATGTGLVAIPAAQLVGEGGSVLGQDISAAMLEEAKRKAHQLGLTNIRFQQGDAEQAELAAGSFDVITCSSAIIYLQDVHAALVKVRSWLKPGGRLVFNTPQEPCVQATAMFYSLVADMYNVHLADATAPLATPGKAEQALQTAGYASVQVTTTDEVILAPGLHPEAYSHRMWRTMTSASSPFTPIHEVLTAEQIDQLQPAFLAATTKLAEGMQTANGIENPYVMLWVVGVR
ncbi:hypothetical protein WJX72_000139 [[Myrmecia] bisecta]|uniref:tRNA (guanine(9)-N(1))-methyltransferase n=1 Tax=[Myrmecia] bisecta TaxID=41462 RepID=A0AAW1Q7X4_9CHLO